MGSHVAVGWGMTRHMRGYKPAFTCGFRGFARRMKPPGSVPAPTIDQVRRLERTYACKIIVKAGWMYFKEGGQIFTEEEAAIRQIDKAVMPEEET